MKCVVCQNNCRILFEASVMHKYMVKYYQCTFCETIQTEKPYWLNEAYQKAITDLDLGLLSRNITLSRDVLRLIARHFNVSARFLDYGGGYGILVRLLRDKGLDFYRQDVYCENIFAANHDINDLNESQRIFELVTCFEVLEHTDAPIELFAEIRKYTSNILFSTHLVPDYMIQKPNDWWYFTPETGQHVTFYTLKGLSALAEKSGMHLYSNGQNMHLFTQKTFSKNPLMEKNSVRNKLRHVILSFLSDQPKCCDSLIDRDLDVAKKKMWGSSL
jgi:hypothetical protein